MKELTVRTSAHLVDHSWFEIDHHATRHMLSSTCFREEGVEGIVTTSDGFIAWHLPVRLDTMLEAEKLPTCISICTPAWPTWMQIASRIALRRKRKGRKNCAGKR